MMTAQRTLNPTIISAYNYFLPLIGAGISVAIGLGTVDLYTVLATVLILTGVVFVNKSNNQSQVKSDTKKLKACI